MATAKFLPVLPPSAHSLHAEHALHLLARARAEPQAHIWFQLYVTKDRGFAIAHRACRGRPCSALMLTVTCPCRPAHCDIRTALRAASLKLANLLDMARRPAG